MAGKTVMLGIRLDPETRAAFKAWCAGKQVSAQAVLRDDGAASPGESGPRRHPARPRPRAGRPSPELARLAAAGPAVLLT